MAELPKFQQHQYDFAAHIRDPQRTAKPDSIEDRRMAIYRDLFYNNVEGFLARSFPVLRKIFDDTQWHQMVRDFFSRHHSETPYFLEIPKEFLAYLENERDTSNDPSFIYELAHYEWVELALSILDEDIDSIDCDAQGSLLEQIPVLSPTAWSLAYTYPVHQIKPDFQPSEPGEQATFIIVYRDRKNKVGFIEINPITARLFELMESNKEHTGRQLLENLAKEIQHPNTEVVVTGGEEIFNNLRTHDIILGTANITST